MAVKLTELTLALTDSPTCCGVVAVRDVLTPGWSRSSRPDDTHAGAERPDEALLRTPSWNSLVVSGTRAPTCCRHSGEV